VPPGIAITTDHSPDAQRWKEVPPRQFHIPSVLQAPVKAAVAEPGDEEPEEGITLGVETDGSEEVPRDDAVPAAAAEVVATTEANVVRMVVFPPRLPAANPLVGVVPATVLGLEDPLTGVTADTAAAVLEAPTPVYSPLLGEEVAGATEEAAAELPPADAEPAGTAPVVALEEDEPLPPIGKQFVPTGFA
jgi:hypothetical protein